MQNIVRVIITVVIVLAIVMAARMYGNQGRALKTAPEVPVPNHPAMVPNTLPAAPAHATQLMESPTVTPNTPVNANPAPPENAKP